MGDREFDIVLFGASGFVGTLTAAHLAAAAGPQVSIALAGRSQARLEAARSALGESAQNWALVEVEATDTASLHTLAGRSTVLATTVGPYLRYGKEVVRAAADQGTHYADLTGEVLFVRWSMDEVADRARETGARIVHSCGFDSVPSDLGVLLAAERAAADGEGTLADTTLVVRSMKGGISGGSIDSARQQAIVASADPALRRLLQDPDALSLHSDDKPAGETLQTPTLLERLRSHLPVEREPATGHWLGPFVMADYNTRIVRLSNALTGGAHGPGLRYRELSDYGSSPAAPVLASGLMLGLGALAAGLSWAPTRAVLDRFLPEPGEGPSPERMAAGRFRMEIDSTTTTGARYRSTVAAPYDPGYGGTAIMLGQSALCLALDGPRLPDRAGVLTPAAGLGDSLADRLRTQGFTCDVERVG